MSQFGKAATFTHLALDMLVDERPAKAMETAKLVLQLLSDKVVFVPQPLKVFGISEVEKTFRLFQGGAHYGKMVVEMRPTDVVETRLKPKAKYQFHPDRTYLIAGGFGGIGRSIVLWMVDKGAKNFLILSRSGSKSRNARNLIERLSRAGIRIEAPSCDISDQGALAQALTHCANALPPIAGCIQSAMALKGAFFANMTLDHWTAACNPKITGTWNLHMLLPPDLDFFCCLSSLACIIGSAGQANYAIGNAYMDELARYRNSDGKRTTSINLGWVAEEGVVAENARLSASFAKVESLPPVSIEDLFAILDYACDLSEPLLAHQFITGIAPPETIVLDPAVLGARQPWLYRPLFRHLLHITTDASAKLGRPDTGDAVLDFRAMFNQAESSDHATEVVVQCVRNRLSATLLVPEDEINMSDPFNAMGVDSLLGIELRNFLARRFDADIPVFQLMGTTSARAACVLVVERSTLRKR